MNKRVAIWSGFPLVFVAGFSVAAKQPMVMLSPLAGPVQMTPPALLVAQATPAPAVSAPPVAVSPPPVSPSKPADAAPSTANAPAAAKIAPASTTPSDAATPPAAANPPPPAIASVPPVSAPPVPVQPPEPVVTVSVLPPQKPAMTEKEKEKGVAAMFLFASKKLPSLGRSTVYGYYSHGCLQGAIELPINGAHWEVMRLSRNRNWGHPELIHFLKVLSADVAKATGWHGILIGDMAQPRGGPLPFGHMSHQIGLDVDIWYTPMPDRILTQEERQTMSAVNLVAADGLHVNKKWTAADAALIRTTAEQPDVERVLVNAAIKKQLCEMEGKQRHAWMDKVRPWYGHADHIHVRLKCPAGSPHCRHQPPVPDSNQCGKALDYWFSDRVLHPHPSKKPRKPKKQLTMADLPPACESVLNAPAKKTNLVGDER
jgi:penicillin-insensitive murein DD-endopeptidase